MSKSSVVKLIKSSMFLYHETWIFFQELCRLRSVVRRLCAEQILRELHCVLETWKTGRWKSETGWYNCHRYSPFRLQRMWNLVRPFHHGFLAKSNNTSISQNPKIIFLLLTKLFFRSWHWAIKRAKCLFGIWMWPTQDKPVVSPFNTPDVTLPSVRLVWAEMPQYYFVFVMTVPSGDGISVRSLDFNAVVVFIFYIQ